MVQKTGSRKRMILLVVFVHALLWAPLPLIPFLFHGNGVWWLIAVFTLVMAFGSLANPAWGSLMADLVPPARRGRYFGHRGKICGFTMLTFTLVAAFILWLSRHQLFIGFAIVFALALAPPSECCYTYGT
jgi:MFS family permease